MNYKDLVFGATVIFATCADSLNPTSFSAGDPITINLVGIPTGVEIATFGSGRMASAANPGILIEFQYQSFNSATGALSAIVTGGNGSGAHTDWEVAFGPPANLAVLPMIDGNGNQQLLLSPKPAAAGTQHLVSEEAQAAHLSANGFLSHFLSIADDGVANVTIPGNGHFKLDFVCANAGPAAGSPCGSVAGRANAAVNLQACGVNDASKIAFATTALTGTTGADGLLTFGNQGNGVIQIQNRLNAARDFAVTITCAGPVPA